jgi:hypothetical protein
MNTIGSSINRPRQAKPTFAATLFFAVLGAASVASADPLPLSLSTTSAGTVGSGANTPLNVPGTYTYGNSLGALTTPIYTTGTGQSFEFYDDYVFSITGSTANSLTSSINLGNYLGLDNFQVRLYSLAGNSSLPVLGTPNSGTLIDAWSVPINYSPGMTGLIAVIPDTTLNPGSYVLEIRGNVSGTSGGSYSGVLNLAPVPLPGALLLLLSGLGGVGAFFRRPVSLVNA